MEMGMILEWWQQDYNNFDKHDNDTGKDKMMTMIMMMMIRFLTAVGGVGLFNEAFTLTVEVMGAKEVSDDYDEWMVIIIATMMIIWSYLPLDWLLSVTW